MLQLCAACSTLRDPSEGQEPLGAAKGPDSAGFWRTVHLAARSDGVSAEKAVQEDRGQLCHQVPVDGRLGHAVDGTLQIQSEVITGDEKSGSETQLQP